MNKVIERAERGLEGEVLIPGDKSVSHRSVMLSGLSNGTVHITHFLRAEDCLSTARGMEMLGAKIKHNDDGSIDVTGCGIHGMMEPCGIIDAGDSGTMLRLMIGMLAPQPFLTTFTGDAALYRRPMGRVIVPLTEMGAQIVGRDGNRLLPITIIPAKKKLHGITYKMPVASAQLKSSLLLAGMYAEGETTVIDPGMSRDHTERMMKAFGVNLKIDGNSVTIGAVDELKAPETMAVPGDISSAAFWMVAASIIENSDVLLKNVGVNVTRTGIIDILREMGADITIFDKHESGGEPIADIRVRSSRLHGVSFGKEIMPRLIDEIPIIAVAAMFADGDTTITGAGELRVKETDRLHAVATEFNKFADCIDELDDGLVIHGQGKSPRLSHATCKSYDDHRISMSLAILGAAGDGVEIEHADCVNISYPTFFDTLENIRK
ncbi:MAG: 3-phosphoshikimate 1-carboxyvinyltransferase [Selenomonadaceae bacterium]